MAEELEKVKQPDAGNGMVPYSPGPMRPVSDNEDFYAYPAQVETPANSIQLKKIWGLVRRRLWLILIFATIGTLIVAVELRRTKPVYVASTTVEISAEDSVSGASEKLIGAGDDGGSTVAIRTSVLEIQGDKMLTDVVAGLKLDKNPHFMEINGQYSRGEALASLFGVGGAARRQATARDLIPLDDRALADTTTLTPEQAERLQPYVNTLKAHLDVSAIKDTRILRITFSHTDPAIAASVANGVAQIFQDRNFETKTARYSKSSTWLENSTSELKQRVTNAEEALAKYMRENNLYSADGTNDLAGAKLKALNEQVTQARTQMLLKQSLYEKVKAGGTSQLAESYSDPKLTALQTKLDELNLLAAQLSVKFGPEHPKVREVTEQAAEIQRQLAEGQRALGDRLRADYERAQRDVAALEGALYQAQSEATHNNQVGIQLSILNQEVATATSLYQDFLKKSSEAKVVLAEQHNNVRVIEPAKVPTGAVVSGTTVATVGAFLMFLAAGVGLVLFLNHIDDSVRSIEDVERYLGIAAVGVIPSLSSLPSTKQKALPAPADANPPAPLIPHPTKDENIVVFNPGSAIAEAYHALRTSVLVNSSGVPPKAILVTSSQPGDGKTTLAVNLAKSLAQIGRSVVVVDCDLRKPATHRILGTNPFSGLSTYLLHEVEIDGQIQKLKPDGLSLMSSGPLPSNPAELIGSKKMRHLIDELKGRYDHVVIDSPPLLCASDAMVLATYADGVLLVVQSGKSKRDVALRARRELESVNAPLLGVVLNNVDSRYAAADTYYNARYYTASAGGEA